MNVSTHNMCNRIIEIPVMEPFFFRRFETLYIYRYGNNGSYTHINIIIHLNIFPLITFRLFQSDRSNGDITAHTLFSSNWVNMKYPVGFQALEGIFLNLSSSENKLDSFSGLTLHCGRITTEFIRIEMEKTSYIKRECGKKP